MQPRFYWSAGLLAAGLSLILDWLARHYFSVGGFNDDACYLLNAQACLAGQPWPQPVAYLPGHTYWLAGWMALLGPDLERLRLVGMGATLATGLFVLAAYRRTVSTGLALTATILFWLNPCVVRYSTTFMSDLSFALLAWVGLWLMVVVERREQPDRTTWAALGAASVLFGFGLVLRTQVWFLLPPIALGLWLRGRRRQAVILTVAVAVLYFGVFTHLAQSQRGYWPHVWASVLHPTLSNPFVYLGRWGLELLRTWSNDLMMLPALGCPPAVGTFLMGMLLALAGVGLAVGMRRRTLGVLELAGLGYLGGHVLWSFFFDRYWLFFWPILMVLALQGAQRLGGTKAAAGLGALLLVVSLAACIQAVRFGNLRLVNERERLDLYTWIKDHTPQGAPVLARFGGQAALLGERPATMFPIVGELCDFTAWSCQTNTEYVLVDRLSISIEDMGGRSPLPLVSGFEQRLETSPQFERVFTNQFGSVFHRTVSAAAFLESYEAYRRARDLQGQGQLQSALAALDQGGVSFPEREFLEGRLQLELGQTEAGLARCEALVRAQPAYPELTLWLAQYCAGTSLPQARKWAELALKVAQIESDAQIEAGARRLLQSLGAEPQNSNR